MRAFGVLEQRLMPVSSSSHVNALRHLLGFGLAALCVLCVLCVPLSARAGMGGLSAVGVGPVLWVVGGVSVFIFGLWWLRRTGAGARDSTVSGAPTGVGAALALALGGDLEEARERLEALVRRGGLGQADAVLGLVAVLRQMGAHERAGAIVAHLSRHPTCPAWARALRVRLMLDQGEVTAALRLVGKDQRLPIDLVVSVLARAGDWRGALDRYRDAVARKARQPHLEAALLAGVAAEQARGGATRAARKALKKALQLDPKSLLAVAVGAKLHPRPAERARLEALLVTLSVGTRTAGAVLVRARAEWAEGAKQAALGVLRDRLDEVPDDDDVRRQYGAWLLEEGEAADWRAELRERLKLSGVAASTFWCGACGHSTSVVVAICPRCDAIGACQAAPASAREAAFARSDEGATLSELLRDLEGAALPGSI